MASCQYVVLEKILCHCCS